MGRLFNSALLVGLLAACSGGLSGQTFARGGLRYRLGVPQGAQWRRVAFNDNDLAWSAPGTGHLLAVNSTCRGHGDPTLEVLTRHLLFGFDNREVVSQLPLHLDDRAALRTRVDAELDGMPVSLELVVLKKNGCVHDFTHVAPRGRLGQHAADFEGLLTGFAQEAAP